MTISYHVSSQDIVYQDNNYRNATPCAWEIVFWSKSSDKINGDKSRNKKCEW